MKKCKNAIFKLVSFFIHRIYPRFLCKERKTGFRHRTVYLRYVKVYFLFLFLGGEQGVCFKL